MLYIFNCINFLHVQAVVHSRKSLLPKTNLAKLCKEIDIEQIKEDLTEANLEMTLPESKVSPVVVFSSLTLHNRDSIVCLPKNMTQEQPEKSGCHNPVRVMEEDVVPHLQLLD